jgi:signal transduction histidine kinase
MAKKSPVRSAQAMRPRARLMLTIGLELISSEIVAVTELVKNSFDADARFVLVRVVDPDAEDQREAIDAGTEPEARLAVAPKTVTEVSQKTPSVQLSPGLIEILDDGYGMNADVVTGTWLEPATPSRRRQRHTPSGRRALGEKGVGRFAAAKLATNLELVTRRTEDLEVEVGVDWAAFENEDAYLDQIEIGWAERKPIRFGANGEVSEIWREVANLYLRAEGRALPEDLPDPTHGTFLRMSGTRGNWSEARLRQLRTTLSRLVSPLATEQGILSDFTIVLDVPQRSALTSGTVEPPDALQRPHYTLDAEVDENGHAVGRMTLKNGATSEIDCVLYGEDDGLVRDLRTPACGPFTLRLRVWDRDDESLNATAGELDAKSIRSILNDAAGVSVYRDSFRVLPYGESSDDWLRLDLRRVQSPTRKLSNNQIVGYVSIGRDTNPDLVDQTNREGLVDGPALADLRSAVRQLLTLLEAARYKIRPRATSPSRGGVLARFDLSELRDAVTDRVPAEHQIVAMIVDLQHEFERRQTALGEVLARYQRLATLGQLVDRIVHEITQPLVAARQAAALGVSMLDDTPSSDLDDVCEEIMVDLRARLDTVTAQIQVANDVLRRIEPFGGRRRGRPSPIQLESAIANAINLLRGEADQIGARIIAPQGSTNVTVDGTELQEVVVNLLTNSLYWLRRAPKKSRQVEITVERNNDGSLSIIVEDSGPGVSENDRDQIFEPYFTTRDGGMGLGLSIAGEIVEDFYGGELVLLPPARLGGARFRATLRRRVNT